MLDAQRKNRGWPGAIVTNANCSAIVATLALAPLHEAFGIEPCSSTTMQAVSGAGYPGVPSLDILGNVIPYIGDEEPKIEAEMRKMLGSLRTAASIDERGVRRQRARQSRSGGARPHRLHLDRRSKRSAGATRVERAIADWRGAEAARICRARRSGRSSSRDQPDRPQPRREVDAGGGMTVIVGRVRPDPIFDVKLVAMGHNVDSRRGRRVGAQRRADGRSCGLLGGS